MNLDAYCDPYTYEALHFVPDEPSESGNFCEQSGLLIGSSGVSFLVQDGIPNFVQHSLSESDNQSLEWYRENFNTYDQYLPLTFATFGVDEDQFRKDLVGQLALRPGDRVLETGCGTGRDTDEIKRQLEGLGSIWAVDISEDIVREAALKIQHDGDVDVEFACADAQQLPFPAAFFDKVFHFGGFNTYGDKTLGLSEMVRVVRPGGTVVVGDESMPVWLRTTEFGKVLMNSNPHYRYELPLDAIPIEARDVVVRFVLGGAFYVITFVRGEGEPYADFDFEIPGRRGGTHRKRFYGQLEAINPHLRDEVFQRAKDQGVSTVEWLERTLRGAVHGD